MWKSDKINPETRRRLTAHIQIHFIKRRYFGLCSCPAGAWWNFLLYISAERPFQTSQNFRKITIINCCAGSYGIFHSILWDKKKEPGFSKCSVYSGNIWNFRKHLYGTARTAVPSADFVISRNNFIVMKKQRRGNRSGISFWISREILFTNHI